jgi:hypothetical protein
VPSSRKRKCGFCSVIALAMWDVLRSCAIKGADEQFHRGSRAQRYRADLREANIRAVFTTGKKRRPTCTENFVFRLQAGPPLSSVHESRKLR